ncbi:MAG: hypothetical protein A3I92_01015 [Candidatus Yanofskybacteria bacterium RIFCSPLOWO2_02_FULL_43_10b]|uniref:DUF444 family protein n=1 Tax=Candidatus Yanofskybacteria bacterium RIFCSPLOWO2_02_FULL_43_10b TaxID=1802704 RepID=A0A1F8H4U6_9BACT|nr:MAG: hypothetical protein A3I92_01015 [Candidatus Yanofskybacteria bacterium RIFCSPLOWO2_02_FULL_43_10b]
MSRIFRSKLDEEEFLKIVRGSLRKDLRRYLGRGMIRIPRKDGSGIVAIPIETIEIPTLRYGYPEEFMIGQGDGQVGDDLGPTSDQGRGKKPAGGQGHGGRRTIEIDISTEEFRKMFQEELELPNIKPKGERSTLEEKDRWTTISKHGSPSQTHLQRTMKEAMKRAVADGSYRPPAKTTIIPNSEEFRYKSYEKILEPKNNAVCFWQRDGSGSMGQEELVVVSYLVDLCEFWLSFFYDKLENVYIIHDDRAFEVTREQFLKEDWGGGTTCSSALAKMLEITGERFNPQEWNIYSTYLSDGLNYTADNEIFKALLLDKVLPIVNQFNYGQIDLYRSWWEDYQDSSAKTNAGIFSDPGTIGALIEDLEGDIENIAFAEIDASDEKTITDTIKTFFGKGN